MPIDIDALRELGLFGLAALAVWALYFEKVVSGKRYGEAMSGWKESTTAVNRLADALEKKGDS